MMMICPRGEYLVKPSLEAWVKVCGLWVLSVKLTVFGSFFMFSNFYRLDLHHKTRVASANLQLNISNNWIENQTSPPFI